MIFRKTGFFQAVGVVAYCSAIAGIMFNGNKFFGKTDTFMTPILVLTMLSTSALICSLLVFYKPYLLFLKGKKKEAMETVVSTAASLFGFLILLFTIMFVTKQ